MICKHFLQYCELHFYSSIMYFVQFLNFHEVQFFFCCLCLWCHTQEINAKSTSLKLCPMFPSKNFIILAFNLVFDLFWVNSCIWCEVRVQLHTFVCRYPIILTPFVERNILSTLTGPGTIVKNEFTIDLWIYFLVSYFYLIGLCLYLWHYHIVLITVAL